MIAVLWHCLFPTKETEKPGIMSERGFPHSTAVLSPLLGIETYTAYTESEHIVKIEDVQQMNK